MTRPDWYIEEGLAEAGMGLFDMEKYDCSIKVYAISRYAPSGCLGSSDAAVAAAMADVTYGGRQLALPVV